MPTLAKTEERLVAFRAGDRRFALPASQVREIAAIPPITIVPHAPASLLGVATVRGEATAILSATALLGLDEGETRQLLLLEGNHPTALAIDRVEAVISDTSDVDRPDFDALVASAFPIRASKAHSGARADDMQKITHDVERLDLLAFAIGNQLFALALEEIVSVERMPRDIARLPRADRSVVGTTAWRDTVLPLFSLAALLDLTGEAGVDARIVVVRAGNTMLGLVVDHIHALLRPPVDRIDQVPAALLRAESEAIIQAIHRPAGGGRLVSILSAGQLLRETKAQRVSAPSDAKRPETAARSTTEALLIVLCGGHRLAFPLDIVHGIARVPDLIAAAPGTPVFIRGVAAHRGFAIPIVDLAAHLTGRPGEGAKARLLIVQIADAEAALLVDAVEGISRVEGAAVADTPLAQGRTRTLGRTVSLDDGLTATLVVSPDALFEQLEADLVADFANRSVAHP